LFGFDSCALIGSQVYIGNSFPDITTAQLKMVIIMSYIGAAIGSFGFGSLSDDFGRKKLIMMGDLCFMFGIILFIGPTNVNCLIIGRFFAGFGIGTQMSLVPLYLSEIAPIEVRGRIISSCILNFAVGQLIAGSFENFIGEHWRSVFLAGLVPAMI